MRWNHPERGAIAPDDFIPHAEKTGLIVELGRFALSRAAGDLGSWQKMFPLQPPLFVGVNVSRRQLIDRELENILPRLIASSGVIQGTLKLELTESAASAGKGMPDILRRLRDCGVSLAIDDFGTGLSTLSELKNVPFDTVKIDKSFLVPGTSGEGEGALVLRSIVNLAHELGRSVVLEGVECEMDASWLKQIGCDYAQGFYFAASLARGEVPDFIALHRAGAAAPASGMAGVSGET
jgi:EAL domain-containing protein (putative c-di-GMP-specific phosphodiesterase class I)